jgi:hypothetical protein
MKTQPESFARTGEANAIKINAHGLFLKKEYFCILNLKIGVSAYF